MCQNFRRKQWKPDFSGKRWFQNIVSRLSYDYGRSPINNKWTRHVEYFNSTYIVRSMCRITSKHLYSYTCDRSYSSWFNSAKLKHMKCIHVHVLSCKFWIYVYRVAVDAKFTTCFKICIYYYPVSSCCELCIYIFIANR